MLVLGTAWILWAVSDALLRIGPLDRAAFGWLVVVPLLVIAVPVAGEAWDGLDRGGRTLAALALAVSVAAVVATALSRAFLSVDCQTGPLWAPTELVVRSIVVSAVAGGAYAVGGLLTIGSGPSWSARRWIIGSGIGIGVGVAWLIAFTLAMPFAMCARP
jgi:hypothetical protein